MIQISLCPVKVSLEALITQFSMQKLLYLFP